MIDDRLQNTERVSDVAFLFQSTGVSNTNSESVESAKDAGFTFSSPKFGMLFRIQ